ncbi:hypothetical protein D3C76_1521340 [compost metagenome]
MDNQDEQFEMYRDPFRMLTLLIDLVCQEKGLEFQWESLPSFENGTFRLNPAAADGEPQFIFKKDDTRIGWYQTFGRDIHCSKELTRADYNKMFVECMASLYGK